METAEQKTIEQTKTVISPTNIILVNPSEVVDILTKIKSSTFFEMTCITDPNYLKTNNPFYDPISKTWLVEKVATINGMFATDYEKGVQKASDDPDFQAQEHKWAAHYNGSKVIMINKKEENTTPTKFYAAFRALRADDVYFRYKSDTKLLTETETTDLKKFKSEKESYPITWRTVTIDNIYEIRMNKKIYRMRGIFPRR
jgi:hypothetical protein